jgi:cytochrome b561
MIPLERTAQSNGELDINSFSARRTRMTFVTSVNRRRMGCLYFMMFHLFVAGFLLASFDTLQQSIVAQVLISLLSLQAPKAIHLTKVLHQGAGCGA